MLHPAPLLLLLCSLPAALSRPVPSDDTALDWQEAMSGAQTLIDAGLPSHSRRKCHKNNKAPTKQCPKQIHTNNVTDNVPAFDEQLVVIGVIEKRSPRNESNCIDPVVFIPIVIQALPKTRVYNVNGSVRIDFGTRDRDLTMIQATDVVVELVAPNGQWRESFTKAGAKGNHFVSLDSPWGMVINFTTTVYACSKSALHGSWVPIAGEWTLVVRDSKQEYIGQVKDWKLDFTAAAGAPFAPGTPRVILNNSCDATVRWGKADNNGAEITCYKVQMLSTGMGPTEVGGLIDEWPYTCMMNLTRSYIFHDLILGYNYSFRVAALNEIGWGLWSEWANVTVESGPPDAPGAPLLLGSTHSSLHLKWEPPIEHGSVINSYTLTIVDSSHVDRMMEVTTEDTEYFVDDLKPDVKYKILLTARNKVGNSPYSEATIVSTAGRTSESIEQTMEKPAPAPAKAAAASGVWQNSGVMSLSSHASRTITSFNKSLVSTSAHPKRVVSVGETAMETLSFDDHGIICNTHVAVKLVNPSHIPLKLTLTSPRGSSIPLVDPHGGLMQDLHQQVGWWFHGEKMKGDWHFTISSEGGSGAMAEDAMAILMEVGLTINVSSHAASHGKEILVQDHNPHEMIASAQSNTAVVFACAEHGYIQRLSLCMSLYSNLDSFNVTLLSPSGTAASFLLHETVGKEENKMEWCVSTNKFALQPVFGEWELLVPTPPNSSIISSIWLNEFKMKAVVREQLPSC